jgi:hypothetical protein
VPIVNVANHFIENNGNPVDPDSKVLHKKRKENENRKKK